jgi:hypothetical protein
VPALTPKSVVSDPKAVTVDDRLQKLMELREKHLITRSGKKLEPKNPDSQEE